MFYSVCIFFKGLDFIAFVSKFIAADNSAISLSPMSDFMCHNDSKSKPILFVIILESLFIHRSYNYDIVIFSSTPAFDMLSEYLFIIFIAPYVFSKDCLCLLNPSQITTPTRTIVPAMVNDAPRMSNINQLIRDSPIKIISNLALK